MKVLLLLLLIFLNSHARAQSRWTVQHNGNTILTATTEDTLANRVLLQHGALKKWGALSITYTETPQRTNWKRTIFLTNAAQTGEQRKSGNRIKIRNRRLRKLFAQTPTWYAATWALPIDPAVAATVRVRRIPLCTLILQ